MILPMILPLKKQVTSLDISKQLKKEGFPQDTYFYWRERIYLRPHYRSKDVMKGFDKNKRIYPLLISREHCKESYGIVWLNSDCRVDCKFNYYAAPSVAELAEMLPYRLGMTDNDYWLHMTKLKHGNYDISYRTVGKVLRNDVESITHCVKFADALAKMRLYLKKEGLIK